MQDGGLAIVPTGAQCGDEVCIISGAVAPCLLRLNPDGCWVLVSGDCFVFALGSTDISSLMEYVGFNQDTVETFTLR